ncbi:MAG: nitroreductase family protein [candidate division WOR-3 bacterium]|nr:nitroreductase family protein [candidate division WOR-3 bacterium]
MNVVDAINARRAYRSLAPVVITEELVRDLVRCAQLAPTCNNNQPARFVFVWEPAMLEKVKTAFSKGNAWCNADSMVIAIFAEKKADCLIKDREYYLFDTGLQTAFLILRATELGLVAHPIAGYSPETVREVLGIPDTMQVITLVNVGRHADTISPVLSPKQVEQEAHRPERLPLEQVAFFNYYPAPEGSTT